MNLSEMDAAIEQVLEILDEVSAAMKPMVKEEFDRHDPILAAWNLIGGSRNSIRAGQRFFRQAERDIRKEASG